LFPLITSVVIYGTVLLINAFAALVEAGHLPKNSTYGEIIEYCVGPTWKTIALTAMSMFEFGVVVGGFIFIVQKTIELLGGSLYMWVLIYGSIFMYLALLPNLKRLNGILAMGSFSIVIVLTVVILWTTTSLFQDGPADPACLWPQSGKGLAELMSGSFYVFEGIAVIPTLMAVSPSIAVFNKMFKYCIGGCLTLEYLMSLLAVTTYGTDVQSEITANLSAVPEWICSIMYLPPTVAGLPLFLKPIQRMCGPNHAQTKTIIMVLSTMVCAAVLGDALTLVIDLAGALATPIMGIIVPILVHMACTTGKLHGLKGQDEGPASARSRTNSLLYRSRANSMLSDGGVSMTDGPCYDVPTNLEDTDEESPLVDDAPAKTGVESPLLPTRTPMPALLSSALGEAIQCPVPGYRAMTQTSFIVHGGLMIAGGCATVLLVGTLLFA
ncbi:hypothetical protein KIPB_004819, partial [Kipferlia bialata]